MLGEEWHPKSALEQKQLLWLLPMPILRSSLKLINNKDTMVVDKNKIQVSLQVVYFNRCLTITNKKQDNKHHKNLKNNKVKSNRVDKVEFRHST